MVKSELTLQAGSHTPHSSVDQVPREVIAAVFVPCLPKIKQWLVLESGSTKDDVPVLLCNVCSPREWLLLKLANKLPRAREEEVISDHIHLHADKSVPRASFDAGAIYHDVIHWIPRRPGDNVPEH